ncbi:MAG TPA: helix-turn-helix transcriptional regulator [Symbiobacteriaceae bacterium]
MPKWTRLIELRKAAGLSQEELAERLGIIRSRLGNYELGDREPEFALMNRIADFFGITLDELVGRTDQPSPANIITAEWRECVAQAKSLGFTPEQVIQALHLVRSLKSLNQEKKDREG